MVPLPAEQSSFLVRAFAPRGVPGRIVNQSWLGARVRASAVTMDGFLWDGDALPRPPEDHRAYFVLPVVGDVHVLARGIVARPGQAVVFGSAAASFDESVVVASPHRALALRIDRALVRPLAEPLVVGVPSALAGAAFEAIRRGEPPPLAELARVLEREGVLVGGDLEAPVAMNAADASVARALGRALTFDGDRPTLVDLERAGMPVSTRQARRRVDGFLARHRMPFAHWRELRQSFVLTGTVLALSLDGARTGAVARAAGFASPAGLCHALKHAGLPAPGAIARAAARLRPCFG